MRPPRSRHEPGGVLEEDLRGRALPLRIGRREVRADVAFAERAVDRVGERVERRVGVGVAGQPWRVRDAHAAEPDVIAGLERMDVEARAGPRFHPLSSQQPLGPGEIVGQGDLDVARRCPGS